MFQEIIYEVEPDYIVECGMNIGGTTLYIASILDQLGHGRVITIDASDNRDKKVARTYKWIKSNTRRTH